MDYWAVFCLIGGAGFPLIGLGLLWSKRIPEGATVLLAGLSFAALCIVSRIG